VLSCASDRSRASCSRACAQIIQLRTRNATKREPDGKPAISSGQGAQQGGSQTFQPPSLVPVSALPRGNIPILPGLPQGTSQIPNVSTIGVPAPPPPPPRAPPAAAATGGAFPPGAGQPRPAPKKPVVKTPKPDAAAPKKKPPKTPTPSTPTGPAAAPGAAATPTAPGSAPPAGAAATPTAPAPKKKKAVTPAASAGPAQMHAAQGVAPAQPMRQFSGPATMPQQAQGERTARARWVRARGLRIWR
jgi:hypothetical protein